MNIAAAFAATILLAASPSTPKYDSDQGEEYNNAYRKGFKEGFSEGYRKGLEEVERRAAAAAAAAAEAAKPRPTGPITVSNAYYGTSSKNCNATHWLARRVNGKRSASVTVENTICGDPAPGQRKSLEVTYVCGTMVKTESAFEHRTAYLDCTS